MWPFAAKEKGSDVATVETAATVATEEHVAPTATLDSSRDASESAPNAASPAAGDASEARSSDPPAATTKTLNEQVVDELKKVYDPEIPVNIYDLGLVYSVEIDSANVVSVKMTLTAPGCPVAGSLPGEVERRVRDVPGVTDAKVELVWDPPWHPGMMSKLARVMLGM
jgi:FeS assembly SUF system protein